MKKTIQRFICSFLAVLFCIGNISFSSATEESTLEDINYTESLETFTNPERGFYKTFGYNFKTEGNVAPTKSRLNGNLIHLRLSLGAFSKAVNSEADLELTEDMLNTFDTMLKTIKENGGTAIVRFAYDNFNGTKNLEPSLEMILRHIDQLSPIFYENKDVISYIELGFFGPWGEMHSSDICTYENVSLAIDAMLKSAPTEITIGVRHPGYYTAWKEIDRNTLNEDISEKGTDAYRVGLFNDGYLGSESDLGTFKNREIETAWLSNQARHTFYGGEVVASFGKKDFNTTEYISQEGFITHTTYLNAEWNQSVINKWKEEIYNGEDKLYQGQTGYNYISNHLGYRFVVRESYIDDVAKNEELQLNLKIENVGFANVINQKQVSIVLEKDGQLYEIKTNIDVTTWNSKETTDIPISITLPENISLGEWNVYVRVSKYGDLETDNHYQVIRFANQDIWNEEIGANYIGNVMISEAKEEIPEEVETPNEEEQLPNIEETIQDELQSGTDNKGTGNAEILEQPNSTNQSTTNKTTVIHYVTENKKEEEVIEEQNVVKEETTQSSKEDKQEFHYTKKNVTNNQKSESKNKTFFKAVICILILAFIAFLIIFY